MDEKLILNDGTELHGHLIETDSRLFLYIWEKTLEEAFNLLIDPEKTKKIVEDRYGNITTVRGYKKLMSISEESGGMIASSLKKG